MELLVPDLYDNVCSTTSTTTATNKLVILPNIHINNDIERSLFSSTQFNDDKSNNKSLNSSVSEMVFLPLRERVASQLIHLDEATTATRGAAHTTLLSGKVILTLLGKP